MAQRGCYGIVRALYGIGSHPIRRPMHLHKHVGSLSIAGRMMSTAQAGGAESAKRAEDFEETTDNIDTNVKDGITEKKITNLEADLKEQNEKFTMQLKEIDDKYKRSLAETENVRRRMQKQVDDAKLFGIQGFCKDLLEVADILSTATVNAPADQLDGCNPQFATLFEGLTMTEKQLQKVFTKHKLDTINPAEGEKFDPNYHEALFENPVPGKVGGTVAVVTKVGYRLHGRTIRPALVGVFKAV